MILTELKAIIQEKLNLIWIVIILNIDKARKTNNIANPPIMKGFCKLACTLVPDAAIIVPAMA